MASRRHCSVKVACAHGRGHRRYSSYQPRHPYTTSTSMPPITDNPINNSNLGGCDPAFSPFAEHGSLAGSSAASAQYARRTSELSRSARYHNHLTRTCEIYEASQIHTEVHAVTSGLILVKSGALIAAKESASLQTVLHQHAFATMTFQIMPGIDMFNAHVWYIMLLAVLFGADVRNYVG